MHYSEKDVFPIQNVIKDFLLCATKVVLCLTVILSTLKSNNESS